VPGDPTKHHDKKKGTGRPTHTSGQFPSLPHSKNQDQWQSVVNQILSDYNLNFKCTVASVTA